jgi:coenzyme PQQ precursor peptide PqqA
LVALAHSGPDAGKAKRHRKRYDTWGPLGWLDAPHISGRDEMRLDEAPRNGQYDGSRHSAGILPEDKNMAWKTPKIVEISLALEINSYACAEIG